MFVLSDPERAGWRILLNGPGGAADFGGAAGLSPGARRSESASAAPMLQSTRLKGERNVPFLFQIACPRHRLERVSELVRHAVADILARGEVLDEALIVLR